MIKIIGKPGFEILAELVPNTSGLLEGDGLMASFIVKSISDKFSLPEIEFSVAEFAKTIDGLTVGTEVGTTVGFGVEVGVGV